MHFARRDCFCNHIMGSLCIVIGGVVLSYFEQLVFD